MICADLDVKTWTTAVGCCPSTDSLRPERCEWCRVTAGNTGSLCIHGHGTVLRSLRVWLDGEVDVVELVLRRFRCLECGHVMTVAPREVRAWFRYSVAIIARILALWCMDCVSEKELRAAYSDDDGSHSETYGRWPNLRRWVGKVRRLFGHGAPEHVAGSAKAHAREVVGWLDGYSPPGSDAVLAERVELAVRSAAF